MMENRITEIEEVEKATRFVWTRAHLGRMLAWALVNFGPALAIGAVILFWFNGQLSRINQRLFDTSLEVMSVREQEPSAVRYITAVKALAEGKAQKMGADVCAELARVIITKCYENRDVGVTESIVFGLIERESDFNPLALSEAKAYGLTQLLWDTAAQHYHDMGFNELTTDLLFNPVLNVEAGMRELIRLRRAFLAQGIDSWHVVLTSYYYGEKMTWMLLTSKNSAMLPSLEYGNGVLKLAKAWKEKGVF